MKRTFPQWVQIVCLAIITGGCAFFAATYALSLELLLSLFFCIMAYGAYRATLIAWEERL